MDYEKTVTKRVMRRLLPFLILCYFAAYLDRSNLGIAALTMIPALGLTSTDFGVAAGIFFLGYVIFEIPSNVLLTKVGARKWIARIMISWGICAAAMALATGAHSLYALRVLLGFAEAGFFPGVIYYLTFWFPSTHRARVFGYFMTAIPLSIVLGSPISAALLYMDGMAGLQGWQWLFILEGIPAVVLGFVCLFYLTDTPEQAKWLSTGERDWLIKSLEVDAQRNQPETGHSSLMGALLHPKIWIMSLVNFGFIAAATGFIFFLPQVISEFGFSKIETGLIAALPFVAGTVGSIWCGRHSDRTGELRLHLALPMFLAVAGFLAAGLVQGAVIKMISLTVAGFGTWAAYAAFWPFVPLFIKKGMGAAAGIAAINTIGSFAGFAAPYMMGYVKQHTGSYNLGFVGIMAVMLAGALLALTFPSTVRKTRTNELEFTPAADR